VFGICISTCAVRVCVLAFVKCVMQAEDEEGGEQFIGHSS
jgi:hypothetical protein